MSDVKECRSCNAPIIWAHITKKDGAPGRMPFDAEPTQGGTHLLFRREIKNERGEIESVYVRAEWVPTNSRASVRESGAKLRTSHFATCPDADSFRRR